MGKIFKKMKSLALFALLSIISACMTSWYNPVMLKYKPEKPTKTWQQYLVDANTQVKKLDSLLNRVRNEKARADVSKVIATDFKFALFTAILDWEKKVTGKDVKAFHEN